MGMKTTADMTTLLAQAGWLRRFARALVRDADEADDLAQDAMVSAWRHPAPGGRAWLATVARHLAVDRFRGEARRERREQIAHATGNVTTPEDLVGNLQIHRHVAEAVASLAEPFRQTLVLRFYEGLSAAEIARQLDQPEGTVRWRLKEGLERVRRDLDLQHGRDRSAWVAALGPLLPRPVHPPRKFPLFLAIAAMGTAALVVASTRSRPQATRPHDAPVEQSAEIVPEKSTPVRLNINRTEIASPAAAPAAGQADAQSLVEELLRAIQGNDYDAFVAKGSAGFRAAIATSRFGSLCKNMDARLSAGYRVSILGNVRRVDHSDWIFKLEFSDEGDDALVTLAMDGWQAAGFLINEPVTLPMETTHE